MERAKLKIGDIDFWEINEIFAVILLVAVKELGLEQKRINVKRGAIALGHPTGMSGVRIVGTLARILNKENGRYGIASSAAGGGQGQAILLEKGTGTQVLSAKRSFIKYWCHCIRKYNSYLKK